MGSKANATITLSSYRDTKSVTRYYQLNSSIPSKPTAKPPSGWSIAEPTYTSGSTTSLYYCDLIEFSDGTYAYSAVNKSSSYQAAQEAWTKANNAIASVDVEYYLSVSATSLSGGSWSTTAPAWVNGKYMWSRTVKTNGAGTKTYSPSQNGVCIAGAKGDTGAAGATGATGKGVKSIVEQYYKSTSWERFYYTSAWGDWKRVYDMAGTILWSGAMYMNASQTATFSEKVSIQPSGICLVFSEYYDSEAKNQSFVSFFISKKLVANHVGKGHSLIMFTTNFGYAATKYLYISDDKLTGHANNVLTGTGTSGIKYTNNRFVLRYVIGV